jgi:GT2 family glycosyltransferase/ubiquinone/menaquinone biosynthesis C-methylase UbiE
MRARAWRLRLRGWYERHRYDWVFYRRLEKRAMMPWLALKPHDRVCELGCFNGATARRISQRYGCTVYGVDINRRVVRLAQSFNNTDRTCFLLASAESLPFANASFDKLYGISVLEHFTNAQRALQEAFRCLKPGGIMVLTTDSFALGELWRGTQKIHGERYFVRHYYSQSELVREIESVGFRPLHVEPILRHWSTGLLFEVSVRAIVVKSAASLLLPLLRWLERTYGAQDRGYMEMVCAIKPTSAITPAPALKSRKAPSKAQRLPKVGVVILNHNGKLLAERCLRSVVNSPYPNKDVILVDNASTDGSLEYLRALFPEVLVVANSANLGIAGGRNRGFREAACRGADYVLSLDNDAYIEAHLIEALVAVAESDPCIGIVGPKTYMDDGSGKIQCAGGRITYTQNVCCERGSAELDRGQYEQIDDVDYFPGFGFMARREVFEKLAFLDESFYGYGHEDTDFCLRAMRLGYRVVYVPHAVMWHRGSATIGSYSPHKKYLEAVNSVYFVRKYGSPKACVKYAFFAGFGLIYALVMQSFRGHHRAVFAKARGLWDGLHKPLS